MERRRFLKSIVKGAGIALCVPVAIDALRPESITEGNLITGTPGWIEQIRNAPVVPGSWYQKQLDDHPWNNLSHKLCQHYGNMSTGEFFARTGK